MKEQERNESYIHPTVLRVLRMLGLALAVLAVYVTAKMALTFCLGLFADGIHVAQLPGIGNPIVSLEHQQEKKHSLDPSEILEVSRVSFAVAGDMMFHMPIVRTAWTGDGYDFSDVYGYLAPYTATADFASATLETTLAGYDRGYSGDPWFNSPDEILPYIRSAGFDLLLTATEHAFDMEVSGLQRTISTVRANGLATLGTAESADQPRYQIQTVGGIPIGMASYTFAETGDDGSVTVNGLTADSVAAGHLNVFDPNYLSRFYMEVEGILSALRAGGVETSILYLHWGDEYNTNASDTQRSMAQKLCDLGVDVIIGSHPHVVQPVDLLTASTDPEHKTLVIYSAGTLVSNLRADTTDVVSGHTEDGLIFRFTLSKYNDGSVHLSSAGLLPTWTAVYGEGESRDFRVLPLDAAVPDWASAYGLTEDQLSDAKASYNRTMAIVTGGLNKITHYLGEQNAALNPDLGVG